MTTDELLFTRDGPVARITFNRPDARNAMTWAMYDALYEACERVDGDESIRALVLRGAGGKAFVAGTDIAQFRNFRTGEDGISYERRMDRIVGRLEAARVPTLAVIEGYAVGGGLSLAAACDLRVCTPDARFGIPIARTLGNCLSAETCARLVSLIGESRALQLILTASFFTAEQALTAGLVAEVVEPERLDERADELVAQLAGQAPLTMYATKETLRRLRRANLPDASDLVALVYGSDDFKEGVRAFVDKRKPEWTGR
ncbi:MAG: enoyl-CoA hydratase [Streptosporangiales bacterium]|nr:enoyl-CoA hydratase [Streptosporangiales bacterium]